jgi:hypothetical protein
MNANRIEFRVAVLIAASLLPAAFAAAQAPANPPATVSGPMVDPWVPPELRHPAPTKPAQGAELRAQVARKLKADFDAAAGPTGTLTQAQAKAAGLGLIARHFGEIDQGNSGIVRFADVKRFLQQRGAQLD